MRMTHWRCFLAAAALLTVPAWAGQSTPERVATVITPVFAQLVAFQAPVRLTANVSEHANQGHYLRESTAAGENVTHWTQLLTLTGERDKATEAGMTIAKATQKFTGGIQPACPATFAVKDLGTRTISGRPAEAIVLGCGSVADESGEPGAVHSETELILVILGEKDLYTIQWAERAAPSARPIPYDAAKWESRLRTLEPVKLCPIVPGEKAPYPSCLG